MKIQNQYSPVHHKAQESHNVQFEIQQKKLYLDTELSPIHHKNPTHKVKNIEDYSVQKISVKAVPEISHPKKSQQTLKTKLKQTLEEG